jgi:hypothetical protein
MIRGLAVFLGIVCAGAYAVAALADDLTYNLKGCATSEATVIDKAGDMVIGQSAARGITDSVPPGGAMDKMTYECRSVWHASKAGVEFTARCTFADGDGDKALGMSTGSATGWQWTFLAGTGKWEGITGGGPSGPAGRYPRLSPTVSASCWQGKGTYSLNK